MSDDAISEAIFLREFTRELRNKNAAVFAGAGLSAASGYVDWRTLLKEIVEDLGLDPKREHDLVTLAQYHCNKAGGNRAQLTQTIFDRFSPTKTPTESHRILARLPIQTYWTTNYDKLLERALEEAKKVPDVKYTPKQLAVTRPDRDVVVYKMHGDVDHPADAIINKDDYEKYPLTMSAFGAALRGELVEKTFLFLGFSFTDPNIDYILSRVRVQYDQDARRHYCLQRRVSRESKESEGEFRYRQLKQGYFIRDLMRFSVYTVLVDEYSQIPELLARLDANYKRSSIFISGAAEDYGSWGSATAEEFVHKLSYQIIGNKNRVITGFGVGVGSAVVNGALAFLSDSGKTVSDEDLMMRPFPQVATGGTSQADRWTAYRKAIVEHAGIALFVFGNKRNDKAEIVLSSGMKEEFDLCIQAGVVPLPIGATGFMAKDLWGLLRSDFTRYFPNANTYFRQVFDQLGDASSPPDDLRAHVMDIIHQLQKA
jgi:hypothetical protein